MCSGGGTGFYYSSIDSPYFSDCQLQIEHRFGFSAATRQKKSHHSSVRMPCTIFYFCRYFQVRIKRHLNQNTEFMCALCSQRLSTLGMCLISRTLNNVYWTHSPSASSIHCGFDVMVRVFPARLRQNLSFAVRFTVSFASLSSIADESTIAAGTAVIYIPTDRNWKHSFVNELFIFLLSVVYGVSMMCACVRSMRSAFSLWRYKITVFTHAACQMQNARQTPIKKKQILCPIIYLHRRIFAQRASA